MIIPQDVLKATEQRYLDRARERATKEKLLKTKNYLAADSPDIVAKWLRRRGLDASATEIRASAAGESLSNREQALGLERILGVNDLVGVAFLERGCRAARTVARITVLDLAQRLRGYGTGFLVSPRLLLTNHHVFGAADDARFSIAEFDFEIRMDNSLSSPAVFRLKPDDFFAADKGLDFALVAVEPRNSAGRRLEEYGWNPMIAEEGKAIVSQYVNIIQHPNGERKQVVLRDNQIIDRLDNFLHYRADTNPGSSGSPVFNDLWEVVALHHSGVVERDRNGNILALDGRIWREEMGEHQICWKANEGVRISRLVSYVRALSLTPGQRRLADQLSATPTAPSIVRREAAVVTPIVPGTDFHRIPSIDAAGMATWTLPVSISVRVGETTPAVSPQPTTVVIADDQSPSALISPTPIADAGKGTDREQAVLEAAREAFRRYPGVLNVRLGWRFRNGWITDEWALIVSVREKRSEHELNRTGNSALPETYGGLPVDVTNASLEELLRTHGSGEGTEIFELAQIVNAAEITYQPPTGLKLKKVTANMRVTAHAGPDSSWPTLQSFLKKTTSSLTVGMFDFGAKHIRDALVTLGSKAGFKQLTLSIQKGESLGGGTKASDLTDAAVVNYLEQKLKKKFRCAWVTTGIKNGWVASSYHIKVAVQDHAAFWLSSGNWQSSNQPNHDPRKDNPPQRKWLEKYNREWHVVVEHAGLARTFEALLENDFNRNPRSPDLQEMGLPHLLIPLAALESFENAPGWQPKYEAPLTANRQFAVQPLLTPDNYHQHVATLLRSAQNELLIENQTFNAPTATQSKLQELVGIVLDKQRQGVDVRIIFRSFGAATRKNLEGLKDMGFNMGKIRTHPHCHTKGIIVDQRRVLVGSHNWSEQGVSINRDASLLFDDAPLAAYYRKLFEYDWDFMSQAQIGEELAGLRLINPEEPTPPGYERVVPDEYLEWL